MLQNRSGDPTLAGFLRAVPLCRGKFPCKRKLSFSLGKAFREKDKPLGKPDAKVISNRGKKSLGSNFQQRDFSPGAAVIGQGVMGLTWTYGVLKSLRCPKSE